MSPANPLASLNATIAQLTSFGKAPAKPQDSTTSTLTDNTPGNTFGTFSTSTFTDNTPNDGSLSGNSGATSGAATAATNYLFSGFSWARVGAFILGMVAIIAGLYMLKPTQDIIMGARKTASGVV